MRETLVCQCHGRVSHYIYLYFFFVIHVCSYSHSVRILFQNDRKTKRLFVISVLFPYNNKYCRALLLVASNNIFKMIYLYQRINFCIPQHMCFCQGCYLFCDVIELRTSGRVCCDDDSTDLTIAEQLITPGVIFGSLQLLLSILVESLIGQSPIKKR